MLIRRYLPALSGGGYPGPWIAPNWTRSEVGLWTNAPVAGEELVTNGNMSNAGGWTIGAGWDVAVTTPGIATAVLASSGLTQDVLTANRWYKATFDIVSRTAGTIQVLLGAGGGFPTPGYSAPGSIVNCGKSMGTAPARTGLYTGGFSGTVDNFSAKLLPINQILAYRNYGRQVSIASAFTLTTGIPGGVVSRLSVNPDGTFNFVHCYHNGTNLYLDTVVNSTTVVSKVAAAAAYGAGRVIKINFSAADTAQAFYNGVQIGTDQDISAVPAGTRGGLFLTGPGSLGDPVVT